MEKRVGDIIDKLLSMASVDKDNAGTLREAARLLGDFTNLYSGIRRLISREKDKDEM